MNMNMNMNTNKIIYYLIPIILYGTLLYEFNALFIAPIILFTYICYNIYTKENNDLTNGVDEEETRTNSKILILCDKFWENNKIHTQIMDIDDDDQFAQFIVENYDSQKEIKIIIHTMGGTMYSSGIISNILLTYPNTVTIYVPYYAFSAGTIIALSGHKLYMNPYAHLGPVDPQITVNFGDYSDVFSGKTLVDMLEDVYKHDLEILDNTYLKALEAHNVMQDSINNFKNILKCNSKLDDESITKIAHELGSGKYPHHKPLTITYLQKMGVDINVNMPKEINKIFKIFLQDKDKKC